MIEAIRLDPFIDAAGKPQVGMVRAMTDEYGSDYDIRNRLVFLTNEDVSEFYQKRRREVFTEAGTEWRQGELVAGELEGERVFRFGGEWLGCCYIIDEAHEFFPSRALASNSQMAKLLIGWASQQRRIGDDCVFITQVPGNVSKQLRDLAQQNVHHINHKFRSVGWFRQPDVITYAVYGSTPPSSGEEPMRKGMLRVKRSFVYACYDTAAGVGVAAASQADIGQKARGLHWSWWIGFAVVACLACVGVMRGCNAGLKKAMTGGARVKTGVPGVVARRLPDPAYLDISNRLSAIMQARATAQPVLAKVPAEAPLARVKEIGLVAMSKAVVDGVPEWVGLGTDGVTRRFRHVVELGLEGVECDGHFYPWRRAEDVRKEAAVEPRPVKLSKKLD
jgi:hypothetical protein